MIERDRAARRLGQGDRVGGRGDLRPLGEQLGQPPGRTGAAQQIAIDFGQRAERAGDQAAGQHERAIEPPLIRARRRRPTAPSHSTSVIEPKISADHDRGHDRAEHDAALGGGEAWLDRVAEALRLAILLTERLDDLHRAQRFDAIAPTSAIRSWLDAREIADPAARSTIGRTITGMPSSSMPASLGDEDEQIDHAANAGEHVAQRDRDGGADDLLDDRGVRVIREAISDGRFSSKKPGARASRLALHRARMSATTARRARRRNRSAPRSRSPAHRRSSADNRTTPNAPSSRAAGEAAVDHALEAIGDRDGRAEATSSAASAAIRPRIAGRQRHTIDRLPSLRLAGSASRVRVGHRPRGLAVRDAVPQRPHWRGSMQRCVRCNTD